MAEKRTNVPVGANIEVAWRPGQTEGTTNFTVGWADVKDGAGIDIGSVNAKLDGSVDVHIIDPTRPNDMGWVFRFRVQELWRMAQAAKAALEADHG